MSAPLFISLYTPVKVPLWVQIKLKFPYGFAFKLESIRLYTDYCMPKTGYFSTF